MGRRMSHLLPVAAPGQQRQSAALDRRAFHTFVLAPVFDLLRFDLVAGHAWLLVSVACRPGGFRQGASTHPGAVAGLIGRVTSAHPLGGWGAVLIWVAWRWGGSAAAGCVRIFRWLKRSTPACAAPPADPTCGVARCRHASRTGRPVRYTTGRGGGDCALAMGFAFCGRWSCLTLPAAAVQVYGHLAGGAPTATGSFFVAAGTVVLSAEFLLARHLFCHMPAPVGFFQSLAWMGNRSAMVVGFTGIGRQTARSSAPAIILMRLKPATSSAPCFCAIAQCVSACETTQRDNPRRAVAALNSEWCGGPDNEDGFQRPKQERKMP